MPAGFVKLISHAAGRALGDRLGELHHGRDRAQREADPARPGGLLAEHLERQRHRLVDDPALEPAHADGAEHEVGAVDRLAEVGRGLERQRGAVLGREPVQHGADPLQPRGVDVVQDHAVERHPVAARQQRSVDHGHAEAAPADDGELHLPRAGSRGFAEGDTRGSYARQPPRFRRLAPRANGG